MVSPVLSPHKMDITTKMLWVRNEKIGYKIREAQSKKIPYMLIVGDKEAEAGTVSVRTRAGGDLGAVALAEFQAKLLEEIRTRSLG